MAIENLLKNKNSKEKSRIKPLEIAKLKHLGVFDSIGGIKVEIVGEVRVIEINGNHGIELFVRAWKNGNELGFGKDGSVEIERFRIFNPPILVDDPNGTIIREWTETDRVTGVETIKQRKLREDPQEALLQSLEHTIKQVGKSGENIVVGKIGNTTSTFYPDADPETSSVDGWTRRLTADATWAAIIAGAGTTADDTVASAAAGYAFWDGGGYDELGRAFFLFDTSAIGDTDTIDSATLSLYGFSKSDNGNQAVAIVGSTPASNTALVAADHSQVGSTRYASDIDITSASTVAYNDFALNASGLAAISKTGISKFAARLSGDVDAVDPGLSSSAEIHLRVYFADQAGTASDPKLVVVHSAVTNPAFFAFM